MLARENRIVISRRKESSSPRSRSRPRLNQKNPRRFDDSILERERTKRRSISARKYHSSKKRRGKSSGPVHSPMLTVAQLIRRRRSSASQRLPPHFLRDPRQTRRFPPELTVVTSIGEILLYELDERRCEHHEKGSEKRTRRDVRFDGLTCLTYASELISLY